MTSNPWPVLESIPAHTASSETWRAQLGEQFDCLRPFLRHQPLVAPKSDDRGSSHLSRRSPTEADQPTSLQLDTAGLGRALSHALGLARKMAEFPLPATVQIGSWSADAVPAILQKQAALLGLAPLQVFLPATRVALDLTTGLLPAGR